MGFSNYLTHNYFANSFRLFITFICKIIIYIFEVWDKYVFYEMLILFYIKIFQQYLVVLLIKTL